MRLTSLAVRDAAFAIVIMVLLGGIAVQQISANQLRSALYHRCLTANASNGAANDFRAAEVEAFTALSKDPTIGPVRHAYYATLAVKARKAVAAYRPGDCNLYK